MAIPKCPTCRKRRYSSPDSGCLTAQCEHLDRWDNDCIKNGCYKERLAEAMTSAAEIKKRRKVDSKLKEPVVDIELGDPTAAFGHVKLCGEELPVSGVDFHLRAGEIAQATLYIYPRRARIVALPESVKVKIENWEQYQMQGIVNEAQRLLRQKGPEFENWVLYAPDCIDDTRSLQRISASYFEGGKRYGLRIDWWSPHFSPAVITPANIVAAFVALKDRFYELDARTIWLGRDGEWYQVNGYTLNRVTTGDDGALNAEKILDLPDTGEVSAAEGVENHGSESTS